MYCTIQQRCLPSLRRPIQVVLNLAGSSIAADASRILVKFRSPCLVHSLGERYVDRVRGCAIERTMLGGFVAGFLWLARDPCFRLPGGFFQWT